MRWVRLRCCAHGGHWCGVGCFGQWVKRREGDVEVTEEGDVPNVGLWEGRGEQAPTGDGDSQGESARQRMWLGGAIRCGCSGDGGGVKV